MPSKRDPISVVDEAQLRSMADALPGSMDAAITAILDDNRNDTAHDSGEDFAEATLKLLPAFVEDAKGLADMIEAVNDG